jgi:hypothetical protein
MKSVKLGEKSIRVIYDVIIIVFQDLAKKLVLAVMNGFDNVLVIPREVEEATTLPWGPKLGKNVLPSERHQIIGRVQPKKGTKMSKDPGRIVLELEVVFCRRHQLISRAVLC